MKTALVGAVLAPVLMAAATGLLVAPALSGSLPSPASEGVPALGPLGAVPPGMLRRYSSAAATCPGLSWTILAAIGTVESDNGLSDLPGVRSGSNWAGAEGPMQFEPATFAAYARPVPPGGIVPPSPYDPTDAVFAAAHLLCSAGAGDPARLGAAIYSYNHSGAYVAEVLAAAAALGLQGTEMPAVGQGRVAVDYALAQVGTPYRWGGETPGLGFDCSGLVQAAWAAAGVSLPRVAELQYQAGPPVAAGQPLEPGDLVFFGTPGDATHVGLVVDPGGIMVDAPHTGAEVRTEPFPLTVGAYWGGEIYLGATSPALAAAPRRG